MKKKNSGIILLYVFLHFSPQLGNAQLKKKLVDNTTYKEWENLGNYALSNNGEYAWFQKYFHKNGMEVTVLCGINTDYRQEFEGGNGAIFTPDSRYFLINIEDGISVTNMTTKKSLRIKDAKKLVVVEDQNGHTISYRIGGDLIIHDLDTDHKSKYGGYTRSWLNVDGTLLLIQQDSLLRLINVKTEKSKIIWAGEKIENICVSKKSDQIVFSIYRSGNIQYYHYDNSKSKLSPLLNNTSAGLKKGYCLSDESPKFSSDEKLVVFKLKQESITAYADSNVIAKDVDIWNYQDRYIKSYQLHNLDRDANKRFTAVVPVTGGPVIQIETIDSALCVPGPINGNKYAIVKENSNVEEVHWNKKEAFGVSLISLNDGKHIPLTTSYTDYLDVHLSPHEKFVLWRDGLSLDWYCYNISTQATSNMTEMVNARKRAEPNLKFELSECQPEGWLKDDKNLLMYDKYDIWRIDLKNLEVLNITGGYGNLNKVKLRAATADKHISQLDITDSMLIVGLSDSTRYNGFFKTSLSNGDMPEKKCMGPFVYCFPNTFIPSPPLPRKAKAADVYILTRQSCEESPNVVVTTDFINFHALSEIKPQANWNWVKSELITWNALDGELRRGILYKPENFDSTKRYPIIFHYYELRSTECFTSLGPGLSDGGINIPWYVSNGYLVFVPDITKVKGKPGWSALNSVVSAANFLTTKFSWINKDKMGLQGHSYGGYETNYIIAHSNMFTAAQSSSGVCNFISGWGQIFGLHAQNPNIYEIGQYKIGSTPWQNPKIYIENSPIFSVDSINTPLLLLHNKADYAVPFEQAIEFYTALRRLNKPVWLLQYDRQSHVMDGSSESSLDFTIRQQQFFNHYLKDGPLPAWMGSSIPAKQKGIKSGLGMMSSQKASEE